MTAPAPPTVEDATGGGPHRSPGARLWAVIKHHPRLTGVLATVVPGLSLLLKFALALVIPDETIDFTAQVTLTDATVTGPAGLDQAISSSLPSVLRRISLPLAPDDLAGCAVDDPSPATLEVTPRAGTKHFRLSQYIFRSSRDKPCTSFGLVFHKDQNQPAGLAVISRSSCALQVGLMLDDAQGAIARPSYRSKSAAAEACKNATRSITGELAVRPLPEGGQLVVQPAYLTQADSGTKLVVDQLSGRAVQAGDLFEHTVQKIEATCRYNPNEALTIGGQITISDLRVAETGVTFALRAKATDVKFDNGRDCVAEASGGSPPLRQPKRRFIFWIERILALLEGAKPGK